MEDLTYSRTYPKSNITKSSSTVSNKSQEIHPPAFPKLHYNLDLEDQLSVSYVLSVEIVDRKKIENDELYIRGMAVINALERMNEQTLKDLKESQGKLDATLLLLSKNTNVTEVFHDIRLKAGEVREKVNKPKEVSSRVVTNRHKAQNTVKLVSVA